jgi:hypothetical protein
MHGTVNLKKRHTTKVQYKTGNRVPIATRLCYNCCSGKAISITHHECVFVALGINHAMHLRRIFIGGLPRSTIYRSFATRVSQLIIWHF